MSWRAAERSSTWKWSHPEPAMVAAGQQRMLELKAASHRKRSAVEWESFAEDESGFRLRWKQPVSYESAYRWVWGYMQQQARAGQHRGVQLSTIGGTLGGPGTGEVQV